MFVSLLLWCNLLIPGHRLRSVRVYRMDFLRRQEKGKLDNELGESLHARPSSTLPVDPSQRFPLSWEDIKMEVTTSRGPKFILRGVSGVAEPGELVALCGPSGAGKSTLMDVLAMRLRPTSGKVLVGGSRRTSAFLAMASYIPQEFMFVATLTVWETLGLKVRLAISRKMGREEREEWMLSILSSMGLLKVKDNRVGGVLPGGLTLRGLSGGEQRRLHIACGVVHAPSFLFLDEPTSGLDSYSALVLMQHLQCLAEGGRTIISSIHQPRQAIWDMFNKLVLLSEGFLMYFGPVNEAKAWFQDNLGYSYSVKEHGLPADWLLDLVSIGFHNSLHSYGFQTINQLEEASHKFIEEKIGPPVPQETPSKKDGSVTGSVNGLLSRAASGVSSLGDLKQEGRLCGVIPRASVYPTSFWNQVRWLIYRNALNLIRNPADLAGRVLANLGLGLIEGLIFMGPSVTRGVEGLDPKTLLMAIFFSVVAAMLQPLTMMALYIADRQFFVADLSDNLYSPLAYYISHTVVGVPAMAIPAQACFLTLYGFIGMRESVSAVLFSMLSLMILNLQTFQLLLGYTYFLPNNDLATCSIIAHAAISIFLSGFIVRLNRFHTVLLWFSYIFPVRYSLQIVMYTQLKGTQAQSLLKFWGMTWSLAANFAGLSILAVLSTVLGYLAILNLKRQRQMRR
eukprot:jgi/Botrbrau1/3168/Bobra.37_2s0003.2